MRLVYRYTTTDGEGSFSATRRFFSERSAALLERAVTVVTENTYWLFFPYMQEDNLEFYWTEEGRKRFEHTFLPIQKECLRELQVSTLSYSELPGEIVYEDAYQIGIRAQHDKSCLPNPYRDPSQYCF